MPQLCCPIPHGPEEEPGLVWDGRCGWTFIWALPMIVMAAFSAVPYFPPQKAGFGATESSTIAWTVPIALGSPFHVSGD